MSCVFFVICSEVQNSCSEAVLKTHIWDCKWNRSHGSFHGRTVLRSTQSFSDQRRCTLTQSHAPPSLSQWEGGGREQRRGNKGRWLSAKQEGWETAGCRDGMRGFQRISTFTAAASLVSECPPCPTQGQMSAMPRQVVWGSERRAKHMRSKDTHHEEVERMLLPLRGW